MLLSSAWETVLGYSRSELSAMTLAALTHPTDLQTLARLREGCGGPEMPPVHWALQRRDGSAVPCRWYRRLDRYDESLFIVGDAISGPP